MHNSPLHLTQFAQKLPNREISSRIERVYWLAFLRQTVSIQKNLYEGDTMKKFLSVLIASVFAASASMPVYAADTATAPAAAKSADTADSAKTKKPRRHWCKATQQFQTAPCPKKPRKHWCRTTQQYQSEPCPHVRKKWCITTQQFQTAPCPKKGKKAPEAAKGAASAPAASDKK